MGVLPDGVKLNVATLRNVHHVGEWTAMGPDDYGARICACLSLIACTAIVGDVVGWLAYQLMSDAWRASYLFISDHKEVLTVVGILLGAIAAMWGAIATTILAVRALRKGPS